MALVGGGWRDIRASPTKRDDNGAVPIAVGQCVGALERVMPAAEIVSEIVAVLDSTLARMQRVRLLAPAAARL